MSLAREKLVILEPGNGGDSDIETEVDELFGENVNINPPPRKPNEEPPSDIFTHIDWEITNSICEVGSTLEEGARCVEMNPNVINKVWLHLGVRAKTTLRNKISTLHIFIKPS